MNNNKNVIGILGGMGPEASNYMYKTLIDLSISDFGAKNNDDFPEIILYSIPVPDFISSDKNQKKALEMFKKRVEKLNKLDISSISIACNTAHLFLNELQKETKFPFVSMIDEVTGQVRKDGLKSVGIMGTPSTIRSKLYQSALENKGIKCILPTKTQINILEKIIRNIIAGKLLKVDTEKLKEIADYLDKKGAEGIVLGCTELPLVFPQKHSSPLFNSVKILSFALLHKYYGKNTIGTES